MSTTLTLRHSGDVLIIGISGRLTLSGGAGNLRDAIREAVARGERKVLLNLTDTSYVDSVGIGELVCGFTNLTNHGAQLKLLVLGEGVKDLLQTTKLDRVFDVHEDEGVAIQSF